MKSSFHSFFCLLGACFFCASLYAQNPADLPSALSSYPDAETVCTRPPAGYRPVYLSTFSRHGSRYLLSAASYEEPLRALEEAERGHFLTETGKRVLEDVRKMAADAKDKYGTLLPRGGRELRGIMERTVRRYPEIFAGKDCRIDVYSSQSHRCLLSMAYSLDAITASNPKVWFDRQSSAKIQDEVFTSFQLHTHARNSFLPFQATFLKPETHDSILEKLFTYDENEKNRFLDMKARQDLPVYFWQLSCESLLRDELGVNLFQYFTYEDLYPVWQEVNRKEYFTQGPSEEFGVLGRDQAAHTLTHFLDRADEALSGGPYRATLRYGHDSQLTPLAAMMMLEGSCTPAPDTDHPEKEWVLGKTCPMGANIQWVFFRKKGSDDILVKVLLNEREMHVSGVETDRWPFYHWSDLRTAYRKRIAETPGFNRGGWQCDTLQQGFVYKRFSGREAISGAHQIISAVDVDLNNPRYRVQFTYGERTTTSDAFRKAGAVATINATYEKESVFIRVGGKTFHAIDSDIVPFAGAVPQWKTDCSISTDGRNVHIAYTGKDLSLEEQRKAFSAIEDPDVFTSAPMLIDHYVPVGKYFATSSLTKEQIDHLSYEDPLRHQSVRHPRSAAALTEDNHLILIVVDGRRPGFAEGMNAFELTSFLEQHFHPVQAINLDGGGSTALCVKGCGEKETHVVNYPSASLTFKHDRERSVPTHIHILDTGAKE